MWAKEHIFKIYRLKKIFYGWWLWLVSWGSERLRVIYCAFWNVAAIPRWVASSTSATTRRTKDAAAQAGSWSPHRTTASTRGAPASPPSSMPRAAVQGLHGVSTSHASVCTVLQETETLTTVYRRAHFITFTHIAHMHTHCLLYTSPSPRDTI